MRNFTVLGLGIVGFFAGAVIAKTSVAQCGLHVLGSMIIGAAVGAGLGAAMGLALARFLPDRWA